MAGWGFFLKGEDEVGGVVGLFVDFVGKEVVEVVQEWDVEEASARCGDRDVYRMDLEESIGILEELGYVFADGGADGGPSGLRRNRMRLSGIRRFSSLYLM